MARTEEDQQAEEMIMKLITENHYNPQNDQEWDHMEADSYLNIPGNGIEGEEQPIAQTSNDGQQSEVYFIETSTPSWFLSLITNYPNLISWPVQI